VSYSEAEVRESFDSGLTHHMEQAEKYAQRAVDPRLTDDQRRMAKRLADKYAEKESDVRERWAEWEAQVKWEKEHTNG
jgi:hypothetical protein